jgi:hypothetical protein
MLLGGRKIGGAVAKYFNKEMGEVGSKTTCAGWSFYHQDG